MKKSTYKKILWIILAVCLALTIAHAIYAICAYQNTSIIHFISKEWW